MTRKPIVTGTETVAHTRLFRVEQVGLRFANGREVLWERLKSTSSGAVLVVPMLDPETVLLIREYAAAVERYELALPKGRMEEGESVVDAADREIMEEIGYGARKITPLKSVTLAPGYFNHATHMVLAEDLYPARLEGRRTRGHRGGAVAARAARRIARARGMHRGALDCGALHGA